MSTDVSFPPCSHPACASRGAPPIWLWVLHGERFSWAPTQLGAAGKGRRMGLGQPGPAVVRGCGKVSVFCRDPQGWITSFRVSLGEAQVLSCLLSANRIPRQHYWDLQGNDNNRAMKNEMRLISRRRASFDSGQEVKQIRGWKHSQVQNSSDLQSAGFMKNTDKLSGVFINFLPVIWFTQMQVTHCLVPGSPEKRGNEGNAALF